MSTLSEKPVERDAAIRNARLRLIELEIESHRVKAELARLEAASEDEMADELARQLSAVYLPSVSPDVWKRVLPRADGGSSHLGIVQAPDESAANEQGPAIEPAIDSAREGLCHHGARGGAQSRRKRHGVKLIRIPPAWAWSLGIHIVLLVAFATITFTALQNDSILLMASSVDAAPDVLDAPVELEVEPLELESEPLEDVLFDSSELEFESQSLVDVADPVAALGAKDGTSFGFLDSLPADVGSLMSGPGGVGGGGRPGRGTFFGTAAEGKRFLFVVDNSGSMQQGRMETTFLELLQSVEAMNDDQYFFVIFYSDRVYPMFYPDAAERLVRATKENKQKLHDWLPTVELCTGGQLIEAMELAKKLRPQVVYLLSDGAYSGSRTMTYMTAENDWPFVIHTLGMNVRNQRDAANLAAIAQAHGGVFRMVQPSPLAVQMAEQRPIRYNQRGATWERR